MPRKRTRRVRASHAVWEYVEFHLREEMASVEEDWELDALLSLADKIEQSCGLSTYLREKSVPVDVTQVEASNAAYWLPPPDGVMPTDDDRRDPDYDASEWAPRGYAGVHDRLHEAGVSLPVEKEG